MNFASPEKSFIYNTKTTPYKLARNSKMLNQQPNPLINQASKIKNS